MGPHHLQSRLAQPHSRALVALTRTTGVLSQFTDLDLNEFEEFFVFHEVALVEGDHDVRYADLAGKENMLPGLGHGAVGRAHNEDSAVHLGGTGDHVLDEVSVPRAVDVRIMAFRSLVLDVRDGDGHTAGFLFRGIVDAIELAERRRSGFRKYQRDRRRQSRLAVVNVTNGAYVAVWFCADKFLLCHIPILLLVKAHNRIRTDDPILTKNVLYRLSYVGTITQFILWYQNGKVKLRHRSAEDTSGPLLAGSQPLTDFGRGAEAKSPDPIKIKGWARICQAAPRL
jgi:hypothetical protein